MGRHAHYRHGDALDVESLAYDSGIAREAPRPIVVTEHHYRRVVLFVLQGEAAATLQARSQAGKEVAAHLFALGRLRQLPVTHRHAAIKAEGDISDQFLEDI